MGKHWTGVIKRVKTMGSPQSPTSPKQQNKFLQTLKNSPSLLRKKFMNSDSDLCGEASATKERCFHVRYGGRVPVRSLRVRDAVTAVEKVAPLSNLHHHQPQQPIQTSCSLRVDKSTITFEDVTRDVLESLPLFCIAYCATDLRHPRAVALTCKTRESVHCHVFECATRDKATEIVNYIRRAFEAAWTDWKRCHPDGEDPRERSRKPSPPSHVPL
ncbi:uncharacterized protein [Diadema antillarum]|uniref:uncharacterized protein n=1 Tax=Diadema antillarum TaxID=105358 RepID=UPI003A8450D3